MISSHSECHNNALAYYGDKTLQNKLTNENSNIPERPRYSFYQWNRGLGISPHCACERRSERTQRGLRAASAHWAVLGPRWTHNMQHATPLNLATTHCGVGPAENLNNKGSVINKIDCFKKKIILKSVCHEDVVRLFFNSIKKFTLDRSDTSAAVFKRVHLALTAIAPP
jgi:hypothetical protein